MKSLFPKFLFVSLLLISTQAVRAEESSTPPSQPTTPSGSPTIQDDMNSLIR